MCNASSIKNAALSALNHLGRTSFSEGGFTRQQADAIAEAISKAITRMCRKAPGFSYGDIRHT